jgi:hypothetical protein
MSQPLASFQIGSSFQDLLNTVFHSIPKILIFLFVLVIGWFVAMASVAMLALGVIAALNHAGIAAAVTQPVLYTVLMTCGAIIAIGVGGGLVKPMAARWERVLAAAERERGSQLADYQQGRADAVRAAQGQGQPADYSTGPRCLQSQGFSRGPGYLHNGSFSTGPGYHQGFGYQVGGLGSPRDSGYREAPGQSTETGILDDPVGYPGGQNM